MGNKIVEILFYPVIGKNVTLVIIILIIISISRFIKNRSRKFIRDNDFWYRFKKVTTLFSYIIIIISASVVFSDKFPNYWMFSVALK